jgi:hypothetical protein
MKNKIFLQEKSDRWSGSPFVYNQEFFMENPITNKYIETVSTDNYENN